MTGTETLDGDTVTGEAGSPPETRCIPGGAGSGKVSIPGAPFSSTAPDRTPTLTAGGAPKYGRGAAGRAAPLRAGGENQPPAPARAAMAAAAWALDMATAAALACPGLMAGGGGEVHPQPAAGTIGKAAGGPNACDPMIGAPYFNESLLAAAARTYCEVLSAARAPTVAGPHCGTVGGPE